MNKLQFLALSALVVTAGVSATSCSSDEVVVENNPTFDGKAVKTDFAINIPVAGGKASRQSVEVTQAETTPVFKGMKDIYLASMVDATPGAASTFTSVFRLPEIAKSEGITAANSAKIYNNVEVPVGTKGFVFYGTSAYTDIAVAATENPDVKLGALTNTLADNATMSTAKVEFKLKPIVSNLTTLSANKATLLGTLNNALAVTGWSTLTADATKTGDAKLVKLRTNLAKAGVTYLGSAPAVLSILKDLKASVASLSDADLTTTAQGIKTALLAHLGDDTNGAIKTVKDLGDFPATKTKNGFIGLPEGALQIKYNGTQYAYEEANLTIGNYGVAVDKINFPASLNYWVATNAKTKDEKVTWVKPAGTTTGTWGGQFAGWTDEVSATTRTIALEKNIQYSVARLDVAVKLKDENGLPDNAKNLAQAAEAQRINSGKFKVTGILIGGQPSKVDWQLLPVTTETFEQNIFDSEVISTDNVSTSAKDFIKTLVLDNKNVATGGTQKPVNVALELVNGSGVDFYGHNGVIKAGAKFYLVAQLNPAAGSGLTTNGQDHVFVQDHVTKVTFTIGENTLPNAYVGVPDLRSSDLELGLSVDLKWEKGMEFEIEF